MDELCGIGGNRKCLFWIIWPWKQLFLSALVWGLAPQPPNFASTLNFCFDSSLRLKQNPLFSGRILETTFASTLANANANGFIGAVHRPGTGRTSTLPVFLLINVFVIPFPVYDSPRVCVCVFKTSVFVLQCLRFKRFGKKHFRDAFVLFLDKRWLKTLKISGDLKHTSVPEEKSL